MDFFEVLHKRRSVRRFDMAGEVSDDNLMRILNAGITAPSAGNTQPWHFVVVRNREIKKKLAFEAGHQRFIDEVPVVIVVCADLEKAQEGYGERGLNTYSLQDTAAAIQNMLLAATALNLGSCWIGAFDEGMAAEILKLPKNLRPVAMLPIGVPLKEVKNGPPRRPLDEVTSYK